MTERLDDPDAKDPGMLRRSADARLEVSGWSVPGREEVREAEHIDPGAPLWWSGDLDASSSFLDAMGVSL